MLKRDSVSAYLRLVLVIMLGMGAFGIARLTAAQGTNLLQNPGFEGDYVPFDGDVSRLVAPGWSAWNVARKAGEPSWSHIKPQYLPTVSAGRIKSGQRAQEFYELYAIFTGGVYQRVSVASNLPVRFSAWINVWSTDLDDPAKSEKPGGVNVQVGIDPTGGTDGESAAIVWGSSQQFYDEYRQLSVEAPAKSGTVTVFVRAIVLDPVRNNHIYVDDAELAAGSPVPTVATTQPAPISSVMPPTPGPTSNVPTREGTLPSGPTSNVPTSEIRTVAPTVSGDFPDLPGRATYVVRSGDTVSLLAVRFNSREAAIIKLNDLRSDGLIRVGQTLTIPIPATPTPVPSATPTLPPFATQPPSGGNAPVDTALLNGPTVNGIGTYIMQAGDTLEAVARRYRVTVQTLASLNGIVNPNRLVIGQVLAVPGPGNNHLGGTVAPTIIPTVPGASGANTHTVQAGENLFRISLRYNVTIDALMRANGIYNPNLIYVGQVLRIP
jgi:LysM repeat protein